MGSDKFKVNPDSVGQLFRRDKGNQNYKLMLFIRRQMLLDPQLYEE